MAVETAGSRPSARGRDGTRQAVTTGACAGQTVGFPGPGFARCRACGMDDFVAKPVAESTLRSALDRWAPR